MAKRFGFLIDNTRCIGCHACSVACKSENDVPIGVDRTWVKYTEVGSFPDVTRQFQVTRCNHCENPPCVEICPVSAMYQREDGIVEFNGDHCIGCKACIQACPYDAIHIDPAKGTAAKCHFCAHRTDRGLEPACVVVCPEHAIIAGDMNDPASEISKLMATQELSVRRPEKGTNPHTFYIDGQPESLRPGGKPAGYMWAEGRSGNVTKAEQMVQVGYNTEHQSYWGAPVAAYILTKDMACGILMVLAILGFVWPLPRAYYAVGWSASLSLMVITTALLVFDLKKPMRFLYILLRPQWKSWLTRGAVFLIAHTTLLMVGIGALVFDELNPVKALNIEKTLTLVLGLLSIPTSAYTAWLLGQAKGRESWQKKGLAWEFLGRSLLLGSCFWSITSPLGLWGLGATLIVVAVLAKHEYRFITQAQDIPNS